MGGASRFIMLLTIPLPFHPRPSLLRLGRHSRVLMSSVAALSASSYHSPVSGPKLVFPPKASHQIHTQTSSVKEGYFGDSLGLSSPTYSAAHPWPEWSKLLDTLSANGYFDQAAAEGQGNAAQDAFVAYEDTSEEFILAATACLAFARHRFDLLGSLSRKDIEVVVENGTPFLFKNALDTAKRMRSFLGSSASNVLEFDRANTVDLMKYILSYARDPNFSSDRRNLYNGEVVESSVRALLSQLAEVSYRVQEMNLSTSVPDQSPDRCGKTPRFFGQKIEMKRGDWICPRCSFMNFARNVKCIECEEARPRRQLTGGEWECPQCDFFNYGRNMVCLRCDCKRPGETSFSITHSRPGMGHNNGDYANKADIDNRLAVNEEKAQRWFSKVSQLDSASDLSKAADDEDFPEIMPLRKGVNRFVVSTRKTPLERRLANSQYQRNLSDGGIPGDNQIRTGDANKSLDMPVSRSLDEILGRTTTDANTDNRVRADGQTDGAKNSVRSLSPASSQLGNSKGSSSSYAPFMPSFAKKPHNSKTDDSEDVVSGSHFSHPSKSNEQMGPVSESNESGDRFQLFESQAKSQDKEKEEAEKSNNWFDRVAELHDVKDLPSAISDEDFPEIMPMRKGENRFVVSKRKDRSLTSPMYKRKMAMEQAGNNNFVPFVPFPPGYFAKKDKQQQDETDSTTKISGETSSISGTSEKLPGKLDNGTPGLHNVDSVQIMENQQTGTGRWNMEPSGENFDRRKTRAVYGEPNSASRTQDSVSSQMIGKDRQSSVDFGKESTAEVTNVREDSLRPVENQNVRNSWTGKSLEGSAVTEPDPLDMSEEAKAQRWFRRVAQIKDISELSQIPDEDFPSIMPMRKGVNRFVVSKRKTPLERRLTSPQYRRNLPIVSSDPIKKENDQT